MNRRRNGAKAAARRKRTSKGKKLAGQDLPWGAYRLAADFLQTYLAFQRVDWAISSVGHLPPGMGMGADELIAGSLSHVRTVEQLRRRCSPEELGEIRSTLGHSLADFAGRMFNGIGDDGQQRLRNEAVRGSLAMLASSKLAGSAPKSTRNKLTAEAHGIDERTVRRIVSREDFEGFGVNVIAPMALKDRADLAEEFEKKAPKR